MSETTHSNNGNIETVNSNNRYIETTSSKGIQYILKKRPHEREDTFYNKAWNITHQHPTTTSEFQKAYKISQLHQNKQNLNCEYLPEIESSIS